MPIPVTQTQGQGSHSSLPLLNVRPPSPACPDGDDTRWLWPHHPQIPAPPSVPGGVLLPCTCQGPGVAQSRPDVRYKLGMTCLLRLACNLLLESPNALPVGLSPPRWYMSEQERERAPEEEAWDGLWAHLVPGAGPVLWPFNGLLVHLTHCGPLAMVLGPEHTAWAGLVFECP